MLGRQLESLIMKLHRITSVFIAVALLAAALPALGAMSVLTPDGVRYAIEPMPDRPQVEIARAQGDTRARLVVPTTQDAMAESQAQLAFDAATNTLYVVWARENAGAAEIRFASLNSDGQWTSPRMVAAGSSVYRGLHLVITHATENDNVATLVHLAWWSVNGREQEPEYALFAFEDGHAVSAVVANLDDMAAAASGIRTSDFDYSADVMYPPMAMARNGETVDLAFGSPDSTSITRMNVQVRKVAGDVRMWRPLGRNGTRTPRAGSLLLTDSNVSALIINGRLALYTLGEDFKFIVLRNDGTWSKVHSVRLDEDNTADELLRDLRHTVEELLEHETEEAEEELSAVASR